MSWPSRARGRARWGWVMAVLPGFGCGLSEFPTSQPASPIPASSSRDGGARDAGPADPPATQPGVMIAGKFVPRERVIVFLHIGHSNMAGRATRPEALRGLFYDPDPRLWAYRSGGDWHPAREPTAPDDGTGDKAGPGMALLKTAAMNAPSETVFVTIGHGHSGTYGGWCASFRKGALLYDIVMKPARELVGRVTFGAVFTMLGQSEYRFPPERQEMLAECLAGIAADMRGELGDPELPFLVGDYEAGISRPDIAPGGAHATRIAGQLRMVPDRVSRAALVPTDGLTMQDTHHFDMAGHKGWAERAIGILLNRGWARWAR
jgi:Carbohydrate esterase, sialic acid-specific acetylesterase